MKQSPFSLQGKRALVTGAGSGIGEAIAKRFAQSGAFVYAADICTETAERTVQSITADGRQAAALCVDVSQTDSCEQAAIKVLGEGPLDILVNNAGIGHVGTLLESTANDLDRMYAVNVRGVFNMSKAFLQHMIDRQKGSIINLASIGGLVAVPKRLAYCATKFAVVGLTKSMALDHARTGVRINCLCPGRVETPFVTQRLSEYADPALARKEMTESQPMGRMGTPDEIAYAALYLASDEAAFVTGSAFSIDGGWSAG